MRIRPETIILFLNHIHLYLLILKLFRNSGTVFIFEASSSKGL